MTTEKPKDQTKGKVFAEKAAKWTPIVLTVIFSLYALSKLRSPKQEDGFDFSGFGQLPVQEKGRVKPLDTVARNALLGMRGKQTVPDGPEYGYFETLFRGKQAPRYLSAIEWFSELTLNPSKAENYKVFRIDHPEVLGLFGFEPGKEKYFSENDLLHTNEIRTFFEIARAINSIQPGLTETEIQTTRELILPRLEKKPELLDPLLAEIEETREVIEAVESNASTSQQRKAGLDLLKPFLEKEKTQREQMSAQLERLEAWKQYYQESPPAPDDSENLNQRLAIEQSLPVLQTSQKQLDDRIAKTEEAIDGLETGFAQTEPATALEVLETLLEENEKNRDDLENTFEKGEEAVLSLKSDSTWEECDAIRTLLDPIREQSREAEDALIAKNKEVLKSIHFIRVGEDLNGNGKLDDEEDLNQNGKLDGAVHHKKLTPYQRNLNKLSTALSLYKNLKGSFYPHDAENLFGPAYEDYLANDRSILSLARKLQSIIPELKDFSKAIDTVKKHQDIKKQFGINLLTEEEARLVDNSSIVERYLSRISPPPLGVIPPDSFQGLVSIDNNTDKLLATEGDLSAFLQSQDQVKIGTHTTFGGIWRENQLREKMIKSVDGKSRATLTNQHEGRSWLVDAAMYLCFAALAYGMFRTLAKRRDRQWAIGGALATFACSSCGWLFLFGVPSATFKNVTLHHIDWNTVPESLLESHNAADGPASHHDGHHHVAKHGGVLIPCGDHKYNLELVHDLRSGDLEIYVLGGHAVNPVSIKQNIIKVKVRGQENPFELEAVAGKTDHFKAENALPDVDVFEGTVESVIIEKNTYKGKAFHYPAKGIQINPYAMAYAKLAVAYQKGDHSGFNQVVEQLTEDFSQVAPYQKHDFKNIGPEFQFNATQPFVTCMVLYLIALILVLISWLIWPEPLRKSAMGIALVALLLHTGGLLIRIWIQGRPPVTNLYSSAIFISWGAVGCGLLFERLHRNGIGAASAAIVGFVSLVIAHGFFGMTDGLNVKGDTMEMLQAVLDTNLWLSTHVVCITLGYVAMFVAGILGIIYLFRGLLDKNFDKATARTIPSMIYGVTCFAVLFSFVGTMLGGIWADMSWGRFWGWDPKENGAILIVIWSAILLHARWGGIAKDRGIAALAIFGNVVTAFSWFGTNLLQAGLHSYGFDDAGFKWLIRFVIIQLILIALIYVPKRFWRSELGERPKES